MGRFIIKLDGKYLEWSTIVDAPVTYGMTLKKFEAYYKDRYGSEGLEQLPERMARVEAKGCSSYDKDETADDVIAGNRAGPKERELTKDELIKAYCRADKKTRKPK